METLASERLMVSIKLLNHAPCLQIQHSKINPKTVCHFIQAHDQSVWHNGYLEREKKLERGRGEKLYKKNIPISSVFLCHYPTAHTFAIIISYGNHILMPRISYPT